jgi:phage gpG-like protein
VLTDIGEGIVQRTKARFSAQTGPDGQRWKPKKRPDGRPTLSGPTGDLRRQIVHRATATELTVQASAPYAAIHQFGGTIRRKGGASTVRSRTNAKGELLRSAIMHGKGLIFAKASHKRAQARQVQVGPYSIRIPARPFLPIRAEGGVDASLYPAEQALVLEALYEWLAGRRGG